MPTVIESWQRGSLAVLTYWKKAWNTPTVSRPASSMPPASTPMATSEQRTMKRTAGPTALVRKSARALARATASAASASSRELARSRPKEQMTARPL